MRSSNIIAIITARGGSKRIKDKNLKLIAGKSLVERTIDVAKKSKYINKIILSSDKKKILDIGKKKNIEIIQRPNKLSLDSTKSEDVIFDILHKSHKIKKSYKYFILLQPTSPLRTTADIDKAIKLFKKKKPLSLISVTKINNKFLKSFLISNENYLKPINDKKFPFYPSQKLPSLFIGNGAIYIVSINYFIKYKNFLPKKTIHYEMSREKSLDIDNIKDIKIAEKKLFKVK